MTLNEIHITGDAPDDDTLSSSTTKELSPKYIDKKYSTDSSTDDFNNKTTSTNGFNDSGVDTEDAGCGTFISISKDDEESCLHNHFPILSPRTSPSNSFTATNIGYTVHKPPPTTTVNRSGSKAAQLYERNLLKKRLVVPDISLDYNSDDVRTDDEVRKISNSSDKRGGGGYHSENEQKTNAVKIKKSSGSKTTKTKDRENEPFVASLAVKKFSRSLKSPMFLRKSNSFKQTDSAVSSSNEAAATEQVEKRKKRKLSLGKRKKSQQQSFLAAEKKETEEDVQSDIERLERSTTTTTTKPERSARKHRRRKQLSKSQSEDLLDHSPDANTSKVILLYSGHAPATATTTTKSPAISRKNRLETLKKSQSFDSYTSENDDYSSACSDFENPPSSFRKQKKQSLTKRFWKSINSLFLAEYQSSSDNFSTPPVTRKQFKRNGTLYSSMPGSLQKINRQNEVKKALEKKKAKDDLILLKTGDSSEEPTYTLNSQLKTIASQKSNNESNDQNNLTSEIIDRRRKRRSKSVDDLLDQSFTRKLAPDWFEQRKKAHSTAGAPKDHQHLPSSLPSSGGANYEIVLAHEPTDYQRNPDCNNESTEQVENNAAAVTKDKTADDNTPEVHQPSETVCVEHPQITTTTDSENRLKNKEHIQLYMRELKCALQRHVSAYLTNKRFQANCVNEWCRSLSESIKERVVQITEDNFKVVVQVFIGALFEDGIHAAVQSTAGSANNDGFFTVTFNGEDLFAVASIFTFELSQI